MNLICNLIKVLTLLHYQVKKKKNKHVVIKVLYNIIQNVLQEGQVIVYGSFRSSSKGAITSQYHFYEIFDL